MLKSPHAFLLVPFLGLILFFSACKKETKPPVLAFKTGAGYTSADLNVAPGTTILVGVITDAGTDPLHLIYSEVAYDGANVDSLYTRFYVPESQAHCEYDFSFTVRNQVGTERWTFNVNDKDGRLTEKEIRIIVQ
jgi:hypothetical protein